MVALPLGPLAFSTYLPKNMARSTPQHKAANQHKDYIDGADSRE